MAQVIGRRGRLMRFWIAQEGRCALCREKMPPLTTRNRGHAWTFDHVWPRRYGFRNQGSRVLAHGRCNRLKADRDPTGCELITLAAVNARLGHMLLPRDGFVLELAQ